MTQYCVIVDAFSTCRYLAEEFIQRRYQCIHVFSPGKKSTYYTQSYRPQDFAIEIPEGTPIPEVIKQLSKLPVVCVVAGSDPAGVVVDEIAEALGLKQNDMATSRFRRNKHLMAECLEEHHIPHIRDLTSNNSEEIIAWANRYDAWPIIIKPVDGAASEGLSICQNEEEVSRALQYLLGQKSFLGHELKNAMVQPYVTGQEYIVNTVSCEGRHYVSDIWQSNKIRTADNIIYNTMVLLPSEGKEQASLTAYNTQVIDALGYKIGAAHSELILSAKGPLLIETNGRIMGLGIPNKLQHEALAHTQISLTAEAFVDPKSFMQHTAAPYQLKKNIVCVLHIVKDDNAVIDHAVVTEIQHLPSFSFHKLGAQEHFPKTIDLLTSPGWVLLVHEDMQVIEKDIQRIRELEEQLFTPLTDQ